MMNQGFLPLCRKEMLERGWDRADFVYVTGDAYVDHPSFGPAIISRMLEAHGYRVCLISQPDWKDPGSIAEYRRAEAWVSGVSRQYGLHGQPLHRLQKAAAARMPIRRAGRWGSGRIMPQ